MKKNSLINKKEWEKSYSDVNFQKHNSNGITKILIENLLDKYHIKRGTAFEVGCYPGGNLAVLGDQGFELSGIDFVDDVNVGMKKWLLENKYKIGQIIKGDFFTYNFKDSYDFVYSLGFIEHFKDIEGTIQLHCDLVSPGGYLLLGVPNFRGILQRAIHYFLDKENYDQHYIPAMNINKWKKTIKNNGFEILEGGSRQGFDFWVGDQKRSRIENRALLELAKRKEKLQKLLYEPNEIYSPYLYVFARKTNSQH